MRRLLAFATVAMIVALMLPLRVDAAVAETNTWTIGRASGSTAVTVSATVSPTVGRVETAFVAAHVSTGGVGCGTLTVPSGWTLQGSPFCSGSFGNQWWVLTHTAQASETTYSFTINVSSGTIYAGGVVLETSGANTSNPIDLITTTNCTASTSINAPAITTNQNGDLLVSGWANSNQPATVSTAGWTSADDGNSAAEYTTIAYKAQASAGANGTVTATYSVAPTNAPQCFSLGIAPAATVLPNGLPASHAGGPHQSIVVNVGGVAAYSPSVIYVGTATGEGGLCGGSGPYTACTSQANIASANVKWIEGNLGDTHLDPATGDWVGGAYCTQSSGSCALGYSSFISNGCTLPGQSNVFNDITGAETTGFLHNSGQPTTGTSYLNGGPSGSCGSFTTRVWQNPADTVGQAKVLADFGNANATGNTTINGRTWYTWFDDNFELPPSVSGSYSSASTTEYATTWATAAQNSQRDLGKFLSALSPYKHVTNTLTTGGGHYGLCSAAVGGSCQDGAHASVGTAGSQAYMRFSYLQCDNDTAGNLVGMLAERALMSGGPSSAVQWLGYYDIPVLANTLSWVYNDNNCNGVNIIDLEPVASSGSDLTAARIGTLGLRLLLEPNGYDGQSTTRAFMNWNYADCASCHNTIQVFPEYGFVMTSPSPSLGQWSYGSDAGTDGNGCGAHDSGGIQSLLIPGTCSIGTDEQGSSAGVYHRSGQCYLFGTYKGNCTVLWNDTKSTQTIQNSWCASGCSTLAYAVQPTGTEEQYLQDNPSLGTLNPNATGAYGTVAAPATIGSCETSTNTLATACFVVLVQNP